jgi:hypothetical protein
MATWHAELGREVPTVLTVHQGLQLVRVDGGVVWFVGVDFCATSGGVHFLGFPILEVSTT